MNKLISPIFLGSSLLMATLNSYAGPGHTGGMHHNDKSVDALETGHHENNAGQGMGNGHGHGSGHGTGMGMGHGQSLAGKPGKAGNVSRTITIEANDSMRFIHEPLHIKAGETIEFLVTNSGAIAHEFSIGTKDEHTAHGNMMMANPTMHHGPGGSAITIAPGQTDTLIWSFNEAMHVEAACNIPGHYQAGMHSPIKFK